MKLKRFFFQIAAGVLGIWLTVKFIPNVEFTGSVWLLVLIGFVFGFFSYFLKPLLNLITLPLKFLTFGIFGIILNMAFVWLLDILFPELIILGVIPLFWTTLVLWLCSLLFSKFSR